MPPKAGLSQAQKLDKILTFFHDSGTCHTLKDLEANIPTITKIHKMQVKDLIKELTDTNQVNVEKIGSGNWYWAWAGEQAAERTNIIRKLESEQAALGASVDTMRSRLTAIKKTHRESQSDPQFEQLSAELESLEQEVTILTSRKDEWENTVAEGVEEKGQQLEAFRAEAMEATDNLNAMEGYLQKALVSKDEMMQLRQLCYGDLSLDGDDVPELDNA